MTERKRSIDICKFFAMVLIIIAHVLQRTMQGFNNSFVGTFLIMLGLPIFFFFSGISVSYRQPLKPLGFLFDILKRSINYMWPVVLFLILRVAFYQQWESVSKAFEVFWEYPVMGLWFLWVLLWLNLASDIGLLISSLCPKYKKIFVFLIVVISYAILVILRQREVIEKNTRIAYDYFMCYTPIFMFGYLFGDKLFKFINKWISIAAMGIGLTMVIIIVHFSEQMVTIDLPSNIPLFYITSLFAFLFMYGLGTLLEQFKFSKIIAFMGQFTLEAYFLHLMLLKNWSNFGITDAWVTTYYTIGLTLLCIANTAVVVAVTYFIPFSHFLLFGRSWSFYKFEKNFVRKIKDVAYRY